MAGGRPTKYNKDVVSKVKRFYSEWEMYYETPVDKQDKQGNTTTTMKRCPNPPPTKEDLSKYLDINRDTLYDWCDKYPEFSDTIKKRHKELAKEMLTTNGLLGGYNASFAIFAAKNMIGWKDKSEVEHKGLPKPPTTLNVAITNATN